LAWPDDGIFLNNLVTLLSLTICRPGLYLCITNMITNKYESPPNYQKLKQQRLRQIQEDYFPPPKKSNCFFPSAPPRYVPTVLYQPDHDNQFDPQSHFEVCISQRLYTATIFILIAAFFFVPIPKTVGSFNWMSLFFRLGCLLGVGYGILKILDRKARLTINENGLLFDKNDLFIPWEHIIATHLYIDDDREEERYKLVTDYVDVGNDTWSTEIFELKDYDKSAGEIALAINHYQIVHQQNSTIINPKNHDQYEPNQHTE
jgi:hypothetical protein